MQFTKDGLYAASVSDDLSICLYRRNVKKELKPFEFVSKIKGVHTEPIYSCGFSALTNNPLLITCARDNMISLL